METPIRATLVQVVGTLSLLVACAPAEVSSPPNIILISVDTLRADRLPTYGHNRDTGPQIAALADQSVVFENAYTEASHTLAAHTSLLTGLYPDTHGVILSGDSLSDTVPTLATLLQQAGYRTGAFMNAGLFHPKFGLQQGFDHYDYVSNLKMRRDKSPVRFGRDASETNAAILEWLAEDPSRPFFLMIHYYDVHSDWRDVPYESPPRFRSRFETKRPPGYRHGDGTRSASPFLQRMNEQGLTYDQNELDYIGSLYDGGVAYTDFEIGKLIAALERAGRLEDSLLILVADHGEEFGEHGKLLHDQVYEEVVHIPLMLRFPKRDARKQGLPSPQRTRVPVQLVDLLPTITEYLALETPAGIQGKSVLPRIGTPAETERPMYFRNQSGSQYGVRMGRWKWVSQTGRPGELYDLEDDPGETRNLADAHPEEAAKLAESLADWRTEAAASRVTPGEQRPADPALRRELEALGYVE